MDNMKVNMMDDTALEGVTGGAAIIGCQFSGKVRPEDCVIGRNYYVVVNNSYFYGQVTGFTHKDGKKFLSLQTASGDGAPYATPFAFNADMISVYTTMAVSC